MQEGKFGFAARKKPLLFLIAIVVGIVLVTLFGIRLYSIILVRQADKAYNNNQIEQSTKLYEQVLNKFSIFLPDEKPIIYHYLAESYIREGKIAKSQDLLFKLLKQYPKYTKKVPDVYYTLGVSYRFQDEIFVAGKYFSQYLEANKGKTIPLEYKRFISLTFVETGKYYQAIPILESLGIGDKEVVEKDPSYYKYLSQAYFGAYYYDKALAASEKLLALVKVDSPDARRAHLLRYFVYFGQGNLKSISQEAKFIKITPDEFADLDLFGADFYLEGILNLLKDQGGIELFEKSVLSLDEPSKTKKAIYLNSLAQFYRNEKDSTKALSMLDKAIESDPNYLWSYYLYSSILNEEDKHAEALKFDKKLLEKDPYHQYFVNGIGWTYYQMALGVEDRLKTQDYFKKAIEQDPRFPQAHNNLGLVYLSSSQEDKALKEFEEAISIDPLYKKPFLNIGALYSSKKDYEKAISYYKKALEIDPNYLEAIQNIGGQYILQKKFAQALPYFKELLRKDPKYLDAYQLIAEVYQEQGLYKNAIESLEKGIEVDEKHADFYIALAQVYKDIRDEESSNKYLEKGLLLQQKKPTVAYHYNLAKILRKQGKYDQAIQELNTALELEPKNIISHILLAQVYQDKADYLKSIEVLEKALLIDSLNIDIYLDLDYSLRNQKEYKRSIELLNKAISLFLYKEDNKKLAQIYDGLGQAYFYNNEFNLAEDSYSKAISLDLRFVDPHINLGLLYQKKGLLDKAITQYQTGLTINPENAVGHNNLGYTYALQGKIPEAIKQFEEALKIDPNLTIAEENLNAYQKRK